MERFAMLRELSNGETGEDAECDIEAGYDRSGDKAAVWAVGNCELRDHPCCAVLHGFTNTHCKGLRFGACQAIEKEVCGDEVESAGDEVNSACVCELGVDAIGIAAGALHQLSQHCIARIHGFNRDVVILLEQLSGESSIAVAHD